MNSETLLEIVKCIQEGSIKSRNKIISNAVNMHVSDSIKDGEPVDIAFVRFNFETIDNDEIKKLIELAMQHNHKQFIKEALNVSMEKTIPILATNIPLLKEVINFIDNKDNMYYTDLFIIVCNLNVYDVELLQTLHNKASPHIKTQYHDVWGKVINKDIALWVYDKNKFDISDSMNSQSLAWLLAKGFVDNAEFKNVSSNHYGFLLQLARTANNVTLIQQHIETLKHYVYSQVLSLCNNVNVDIYKILYAAYKSNASSDDHLASKLFDILKCIPVHHNVELLKMVIDDLIALNKPLLIYNTLRLHIRHYATFTTIMVLIKPPSSMTKALFASACNYYHYDTARFLILFSNVDPFDYLYESIYNKKSSCHIRNIIRELAIKDFPKEVSDYINDTQ